MKIAIDGPAASGKGTLGRRLAGHFGLRYLDSGSLYRAVAAEVIRRGIDPGDHAAVAEVARSLAAEATDRASLRAQNVGALASVVAAIPAVRQALLDLQRDFAAEGAVIDGRDIGTVVLPDADAKLFVTASLDTRARRRAAEVAATRGDVDAAAVRQDLAERDARDSSRAVAPMRRAPDALLLDTTDLDIEAAFQAALALIKGRLDQAAGTDRP